MGLIVKRNNAKPFSDLEFPITYNYLCLNLKLTTITKRELSNTEFEEKNLPHGLYIYLVIAQ